APHRLHKPLSRKSIQPIPANSGMSICHPNPPVYWSMRSSLCLPNSDLWVPASALIRPNPTYSDLKKYVFICPGSPASACSCYFDRCVSLSAHRLRPSPLRHPTPDPDHSQPLPTNADLKKGILFTPAHPILSPPLPLTPFPPKVTPLHAVVVR